MTDILPLISSPQVIIRFVIGAIFNIFKSISIKKYHPPSILPTIQVSLELTPVLIRIVQPKRAAYISQCVIAHYKA